MWEELANLTGKTSRESQKTFNTNDSQLVPHVSTELAQRCLVSEIGRDRTFSPWYDRTMRVIPTPPPSLYQAGGLT